MPFNIYWCDWYNIDFHNIVLSLGKGIYFYLHKVKYDSKLYYSLETVWFDSNYGNITNHNPNNEMASNKIKMQI